MNCEMDNHFAALKLIEVLYNKGLVNKETFENVKQKYPEGFPVKKKFFLWEYINKNVKDAN